MKKESLFMLVLASLSLGGTQTACGADIDRVITALEAIKKRQDSYNPVDVLYKVDRTYTKYRFASLGRIDPNDKRLFSKLRDAKVILRNHYSLKGDRLLAASESPSISAEGMVGEITRGANVYDGVLFKSAGGDGKVVAISKKKPNIENPLSKYNGEKMLLSLLTSLKAGAKPDALTVTDDPGRVPGTALYFHTAFGKGDPRINSRRLGFNSGEGILRSSLRIAPQREVVFRVF